jgi:hypothetical protein
MEDEVLRKKQPEVTLMDKENETDCWTLLYFHSSMCVRLRWQNFRYWKSVSEHLGQR